MFSSAASVRRRSLRTGALLILVAWTLAACNPQPAPEPPEEDPAAPPRIEAIESPEEHRAATDRLIEQLSGFQGVQAVTAFIIEGEGFIAIQGEETDEYPVVRSLRKEVAMRASEISPHISSAWVTDDPQLFERIDRVRGRINEGETSPELRQEVSDVIRILKEEGTSSLFSEEMELDLHP